MVLSCSTVVCNCPHSTVGEVGIRGTEYFVAGTSAVPSNADMKDEACLAVLHTGILSFFPVCFSFFVFIFLSSFQSGAPFSDGIRIIIRYSAELFK